MDGVKSAISQRHLAIKLGVVEDLARLGVAGGAIDVAFSGGADSVYLLLVLSELRDVLGFKLMATHVNHSLQGEISDSWEEFARDMCEALGAELRIAKVDVPMEERARLGVEAAARNARYSALLATCAQFVAMAHHADDQIETHILGMLRGGGFRHMAGMPRTRRVHEGGPLIIRPLLDVHKRELLAILDGYGIPHVEDPTNEKNDVLRNHLRNMAIPALAGFMAEDGMAMDCEEARDSEAEKKPNDEALGILRETPFESRILAGVEFMRHAMELAGEILEEDYARVADGTSIDAQKFKELPPARASEVARAFLMESLDGHNVERSHVEELLRRLGDATPRGSFELAGAGFGFARGRLWRIEDPMGAIAGLDGESLLSDGLMELVEIPGGMARESFDGDLLLLRAEDADALGFKMVVETPFKKDRKESQNGGGKEMGRTKGTTRKSVDRILEDAKTPSVARKWWPVLVSISKKEVAVIPGVRVGEDFKSPNPGNSFAPHFPFLQKYLKFSGRAQSAKSVGDSHEGNGLDEGLQIPASLESMMASFAKLDGADEFANAGEVLRDAAGLLKTLKDLKDARPYDCQAKLPSTLEEMIFIPCNPGIPMRRLLAGGIKVMGLKEFMSLNGANPKKRVFPLDGGSLVDVEWLFKKFAIPKNVRDDWPTLVDCSHMKEPVIICAMGLALSIECADGGKMGSRPAIIRNGKAFELGNPKNAREVDDGACFLPFHPMVVAHMARAGMDVGGLGEFLKRFLLKEGA